MSEDEKFLMIMLNLVQTLQAIARHDLDEARRLFASLQTWWAISTITNEDLNSVASRLMELVQPERKTDANGGNTPTNIESASQSSGEWHGEGDRPLSNDDGNLSGIH